MSSRFKGRTGSMLYNFDVAASQRGRRLTRSRNIEWSIARGHQENEEMSVFHDDET